MTKHKKIDFSQAYISNIFDINKDVSVFLKDAEKFISYTSINENFKIYYRLIDLLRYSDAILNDYGEFNDRGIRIFNTIRKKCKRSCIKNKIIYLLSSIVNSKNINIEHQIDLQNNLAKKIDRMHNDISLLKKIKNYWKLDFNLMSITDKYSLIIKILYLIQKLSEYVIEKKYSDDETQAKIEEKLNAFSSLLLELSENDIKKIVNMNFDQAIKFNYEKDIENNPVVKATRFDLIVQDWKYAEGKLYKSNSKIIIDSTTEFARAFITNRNIFSNMRNQYENVRNAKDYICTALKNLSVDYYSFFYTKNLNTFAEINLNNISIKKWIIYLMFIKSKGIEIFKNNSKDLFIDIIKLTPSDDLLNQYKIKKAEIQHMNSYLVLNARGLSLLDTPFVKNENNLWLFTPTCLFLDPVYVISRLMKMNTVIQNKRGYIFEKKVRELISKNYDCINFSFNESSKKKKTQHEIDAFVKDFNNVPCYIECKTFSHSYSYKEYRIQVDKMISNLYIYHASSTFKYLKRNKEQLSLKKYFKKLNGFEDDEYKQIYGIFLSNIFFPKSYIENWSDQTGLNFINFYDFSKLFSPETKLSKKAIKEINKEQPTYKNEIERKDVGPEMNTLTKTIKYDDKVERTFFL